MPDITVRCTAERPQVVRRNGVGIPYTRLDFGQLDTVYTSHPDTVTLKPGKWAFTAPWDGLCTINVRVRLAPQAGAPDLSVPNASAFFILLVNDKERDYFGYAVGDSRKGLHPSGAVELAIEKGAALHIGIKYQDTPVSQGDFATDGGSAYNAIALTLRKAK